MTIAGQFTTADATGTQLARKLRNWVTFSSNLVIRVAVAAL